MIPQILHGATLFPGVPVWRLTREDGSPYLDRTVLWGADSLENHDPEAPSSAFIHRIYSSDGDRHMHNHPWQWAAAVVLSGGYTEIRRASYVNVTDDAVAVGGAIKRVYMAGDLNILRPGDYHSIVSVEPDTSTLFLCGREVSDWGFLVDGVHVPHAEYFMRPDCQHMKTERIR